MPNTLAQNVRERTRKIINQKLERQAVTDAALQTAIDDWDRSSYNAFFADCREAGRETARCGAIWNLLKEQGDAPTGGDESSADDASADAGEDLPAMPVPETIDDLEADLQEADNVYLVVTTGCPSCNQAKDALSDWIESGLVEVVNVQKSDLAADIVLDTGLDALPALAMETDGEFTAI